MGFDTATEVQSRVVPLALSGRDLRVSAETGSGKTLAYLLPTLQRLLDAKPDRSAGALAVVLVPTRELARQVLKQCRDLMQKTQLNAQAITGGADFKYQKALLRKNPEVIVATPGRLLEHCRKGSADLGSVVTLVLDEADRMLDMGFRDDVLEIAGFCPGERQVILLSATLKHKGLATVTGELLRDPQSIAIDDIRSPHSAIHHQRILADSQEHKDKLLVALMQNGGFTRALVFANKRVNAQRLANFSGPVCPRGLRTTFAASRNGLKAFAWQDSPDEYSSRKIFSLCYDIQKPMHPVGKVNVHVAGRSVHNGGSFCLAGAAVACQVFFSPVGLCLDNPP